MKLRKYSTLVCGVLASAMLVACSGGNGSTTAGQQSTTSSQILTPISTKSAVVTALTSTSSGATANWRSIAKGKGIYVAVGDDGAIVRSTDGKVWGMVNAGVSVNIHAITFNSSTQLFYAVGDNGAVMSSPNGMVWTQYQTLNPAKNLYSIMAVDGDLVIGADGSNIFEIDTNGRGNITVWNTVDNMKLVSASHGNGVMVLGSDDGSILYKAENNWNANWSRATKFAGMSINSLSYEDTDGWFLAGTSTGKVIKSESGTVWSVPVTASSSSINSLILDGGSNDFFAVGGSTGNSMMVISDNYNSWNQQTLPVSNVQLNDVKCFENNDCVIVGDNGTILSGLKRDTNNPPLPIWTLGGADVIAPTVTMSTPMNNATGISRSPSIQLKFSEPVENVNTSNVSLHIGSPIGTTVAIGNITPSDNNIYTFNPSVSLTDTTTYYVVVSDGVTDLAGNELSSTSFSFTTGDFLAPTISGFTPASGVTNQPTTPGITVTFSEQMNTSRLIPSNVVLKTQAGAVVSGYSISYNSVAKSITINLNGTPLLDNTTYQLILNQVNITDVAGNSLGTDANAVVTKFTTGDFTAPVLSSITPANGSTNASANPSIVLNFSESMNTSTINTTSIKLMKNYNSSYVTLNAPTFSNGNQTATFTLTSSLTNESNFSVIMNESMVKDLSGKPVGTNPASKVSTFLPSLAVLGVDGSPLTLTSAKSVVVRMSGWTATTAPTATTFSFKNESGVTVSTFTNTACTFTTPASQVSTCTTTLTPTMIGNYTMTVTSGYYSVSVPVKVTTTFFTQNNYSDGHVSYGPSTSRVYGVFGLKVPVDTVVSFTSSASNIIGLVDSKCTISAGASSCSVTVSGVAGSGSSRLAASFTDASGTSIKPFITATSDVVAVAVTPSITGFGNLSSGRNDNTTFSTYVAVNYPQINSYTINVPTQNDDSDQYCYVWVGYWTNSGTCTMSANSTTCSFSLMVKHSGANNIFGYISANSPYKNGTGWYNVTY